MKNIIFLNRAGAWAIARPLEPISKLKSGLGPSYYAISFLQHPTPVRPGQGGSTLHPQMLLEALGSAYMSALAGLERRWHLAKASLLDSSLGSRTVMPSWDSEDWRCLGCNISVNFTRDPKWASKACPSPACIAGSRDLASLDVMATMCRLTDQRAASYNALQNGGMPCAKSPSKLNAEDLGRTAAEGRTHGTSK